MSRIFFNASKEQILFAAALAANAARPVGMGMLHYDADHEFTAKEMEAYWLDGEINVDYAQGRCTKFRVWKPWGTKPWGGTPEPKGYKYVTGFETQPDYETWYTKYATYEDLLQAAGITDYEVER